MKKVVLRTTMIGIALLILIPFLWMLSTSLKPLAEASSYPPKWFTPNVTMKPYGEMFNFLPFSSYTLNSLIVAISATSLTLFIGSLAGFAFSRFKFKGKDIFLLIFLLSQMLPGASVMLIVKPSASRETKSAR